MILALRDETDDAEEISDGADRSRVRLQRRPKFLAVLDVPVAYFPVRPAREQDGRTVRGQTPWKGERAHSSVMALEHESRLAHFHVPDDGRLIGASRGQDPAIRSEGHA